MNNSAAKVGEIFTEAGATFNKLAEMTMMLHPMAESSGPGTPAKAAIKRKINEDKHATHSSSMQPQLTGASQSTN